MASTRLTNDIRDSIRNKLLEHAFAEREKALELDLTEHGEKVYNILHTPEIQKAMKALIKLEVRSFVYKDSLMILVKGRKGNRSGYERFQLKESRPMLDKFTGYLDNTDIKGYDLSEVTKAMDDNDDAKTKLYEERRKASVEARAILGSVTTIKKLIEIWPDIEAIVKPYESAEGAAARMLPTIQLADLNKRLGLPVEEKAVA